MPAGAPDAAKATVAIWRQLFSAQMPHSSMTTKPATARPMTGSDDAGGDHGRAESQADKSLCHPTPVVHAGIAGAN